jgi:hypothetical protein
MVKGRKFSASATIWLAHRQCASADAPGPGRLMPGCD